MAMGCAYRRGSDAGWKDVAPHNGMDLVSAFDSYQCLECGGYTSMDGSPTVPTSAIDPEQSTYDGPGKELIDDPDHPPFRAKDARIR